MLQKALPVRLWMFGVLSLAFMAAAFYFILALGTKESLTKQFLVREMTVARAGAVNITSFFEAIGNSVALRSQLKSTERGDSSTFENMDAFVAQWRDTGLVSGIILTDSEGVVYYNSNIAGTNNTGQSVADRKYFSWAKNQTGEGGHYIGRPVISRIGASKDEIIVPVVSPVFAEDNFLGVVAAAVKLKPLTERFLGMMKISERTSIYLINVGKDVLYSSPESLTLSKDIKDSINVNEEGYFEEDGRLVAHVPMNVGIQSWTLIVTSPLSELLSLSIPFYIRHVAVLILVSLVTLAFGIIVNRENKKRFLK